MKTRGYYVQLRTNASWVTITRELSGFEPVTTSSLQYARGYADAVKKSTGLRVRIVRMDGSHYETVEVR